MSPLYSAVCWVAVFALAAAGALIVRRANDPRRVAERAVRRALAEPWAQGEDVRYVGSLSRAQSCYAAALAAARGVTAVRYTPWPDAGRTWTVALYNPHVPGSREAALADIRNDPFRTGHLWEGRP